MRTISCDRCGFSKTIPVVRDPETKSVMTQFKTIHLEHGGKHYQDLCLPCHEAFVMMVQEASREAQLFKERTLSSLTQKWSEETTQEP